MALYLVTGGAGFIGSHLVESLLADGHKVRVLDDLSTGRKSNLPRAVDLIVGDVADKAAMAKVMKGAAGCFHLAAVASVQRSVEDWAGTTRTNLLGSVVTFDVALAQAVPPPVVYASSAAIYGDNPAPVIKESLRPKPLTPYGFDKLASEIQAGIGGSLRGLKSFGLRFFNVYGPRQDPKSPYSGVISIFADRINRGEPVTVFGDGGQTRDFVYVADVVAHLRRAMERADTAGLVCNVCTGRETTVADLAKAIMKAAGKTVAVNKAPPRAGDIRRSLGSPARAKRLLGVTAQVPLADGLKRLLAG